MALSWAQPVTASKEEMEEPSAVPHRVAFSVRVPPLATPPMAPVSGYDVDEDDDSVFSPSAVEVDVGDLFAEAMRRPTDADLVFRRQQLDLGAETVTLDGAAIELRAHGIGAAVDSDTDSDSERKSEGGHLHLEAATDSHSTVDDETNELLDDASLKSATAKMSTDESIADSKSSLTLKKKTAEEISAEKKRRPKKAKKKGIKIRVHKSRRGHLKESERTSLSSFYSRQKHVFIVTWGGRPLYSRFGDASAQHMTSFLGVVSLLPENVDRVDMKKSDTLHCFRTDDTEFVFWQKGGLIMLCVSKTGESVMQLRKQMSYLYAQIVMTLTSHFQKILKQRPAFDMRDIFGPSDDLLLDCLVDECDSEPCFLYDAIECLTMARTIRDDIALKLKKIKRRLDQSKKDFGWSKKMLFALVLTADGKVVCWCEPRKIARAKLHVRDILQIAHMVKFSSSLRHSECNWFPICLPRFEPTGFLYAYAAHISRESTPPPPTAVECLESEGRGLRVPTITYESPPRGTDTDAAIDDASERGFATLPLAKDSSVGSEETATVSGATARKAGAKVKVNRRKGTVLILITLDSDSCDNCKLIRDELKDKLAYESLLDSLKAAQTRHPLTLSELTVTCPGLYAFFFQNHKLNQFVAPRPVALYRTDKMKERLFRRLQHLHRRLHSAPKHTDYFIRSTEECAYAWTSHSEQCSMYVFMNPFTSKTTMQQTTATLLEYITQQSAYLFTEPIKW